MNLELFAADPEVPERITLGPGSVLLRGLALPHADALLAAVDRIWAAAPPRHLITPGGFRMSVALSNCGALGWTSDRRGYRYTRHDPLTGRPWPAMPEPFLQLAQTAASAAGFDGFRPDACLINHYLPGARLSLHQDKDEGNLDAPIVSVSLGIPAVFLFGGLQRSGPARRVPLQHGDVVVWGGPDRLRYHGVLPLQEATHPRVGQTRINLTFRHAG
ncbi:DNA oxidative demethylase AlkB [Bordetella petrii]|uniref:DNA oxidative demethylase AlkB n=1 Tax=Bordetella petrii TaxID=94624 RepID=UPI001E58132D|nr:DNA oxidative demethylase AlkB [Bordetella petrii]MCD0505681.1 DNA oxidative demethylase AlkB [Bordetella petrii]